MALRRRTLLRLLPLLALLGLALAWALASLDAWCGPWPERPPRVVARVQGEGALRAGAARVPLRPPLPAPGGAGYGLPHPDVGAGALPLHARALVLEAGAARVGLVSLELVSAPPTLVEAVRARAAGLGLGGLLVVATHTHSAFGGYDARPAAQLVGMGRFDAALLEVAVSAAAQALARAAGALEPVRLEVGEVHAPERVRTRSGGEPPDGRLVRVRLQGAQGASVAELLVFSAHPTLVPRPVQALDPDWPGRLSQLREAAGAGVSLVLQGAAGNVAAVVPQTDPVDAPGAFARALAPLVEGTALTAMPVPTLGYARVQVALPRPDASRLVPAALERAGETLLCESSERSAEVSALALGGLRVLGVPAEPTAAAGAQLAAAADAGVVLGLSDGYVGYVDTPEAVREARGEARRQYFGPALLGRLAQAAQVAARAAGFEDG